MPIRHSSRHLHATFYNHTKAKLAELGWVSAPVNFGTSPVTIIDYQPEERNEAVKHNTVAVTLGDFNADEDEELGAKGGGLRSALYSVYIDVYMNEQALSLAICDDIRDVYEDLYMDLINQITGFPVPNAKIDVETVAGPERPAANIGAEQFKRHWRIMRADGRLYYNT